MLFSPWSFIECTALLRDRLISTLPHFRFLPVFPLAVGFLQDSEGPKSDLQLLLSYSYPNFYELVFVDSHAFWLSPLAAIHTASPFL